MGINEEIYLIEASPNMVERIPMLIYADDIVNKVMTGSSEMKQKLGDGLIMCIQLLIIERRKLMKELDRIQIEKPKCRACGEEVKIWEMGLCMHCENLMQQAEMPDPETIVEDDDNESKHKVLQEDDGEE